MRWFLGIVATSLLTLGVAAHGAQSALTAPVTQYFAKRGDTNLRAIVYRPAGWKPRDLRPAVVVLHGTSWTVGQPEWGAPYAQHYAERGLVGICAQYRLAKGSITPLDSMADARDVIRWVRANAAALGVDGQKIAVHGLSAGGHLALSAAMFQGNTPVSPAPNALILTSPLLDLDNHVPLQQMLGSLATSASVSPLSNVRKGLPPTIILQGDVDTVAPHAAAKTFCAKMTEAGNRCELNTYMYMGHLFTPKGKPDNGTPQPDAKVTAAAMAKVDAFLTAIGYLKK